MEYDLMNFELLGPESNWRTTELEADDEVPMSEIWSNPWGRYLFLAIKKNHLTCQYFRAGIMWLAGAWSKQLPADSREVRSHVATALSAYDDRPMGRGSEGVGEDFANALFATVQCGLPDYKIVWKDSPEAAAIRKAEQEVLAAAEAWDVEAGKSEVGESPYDHDLVTFKAEMLSKALGDLRALGCTAPLAGGTEGDLGGHGMMTRH